MRVPPFLSWAHATESIHAFVVVCGFSRELAGESVDPMISRALERHRPKGATMNSHHLHLFAINARHISLISLLAVLAAPPSRAVPQSASAASVSVSELQSRAEQGDAKAQYLLAEVLLAHTTSSADVANGVKWLCASASQNNSNAQFLLGYLYEHGQGVSRNYSLAFQNYQAAARQHYTTAENNLASLYQHGLGVPENLGKALEWYLAAAQQGDRVAQCNLASMYYLGLGTSRDYAQALHWFSAAADAGLPEAQSNLAFFYFHGLGVQRDYPEAARLLRLAAERGLPIAQANLGFLYETGKGVPLDYVNAYSWYSRAIAAGDTSSLHRRKELARIMTQDQLRQANTIASATADHPTQQPASTGVLSFLSH